MRRLNVGDTVYLVVEHYYYDKDSPGALMEYLPVEGTIRDFIRGGYTQAKISYREDRAKKLTFLRTGRVREFYDTMDEAVAHAEELTDHYDRTWSRITGRTLRRPWRQGGEANDSVE